MRQINTEEMAYIGRMNLTNGNKLLCQYVVGNITTKDSNNDQHFVVVLQFTKQHK